MSSGYKIGNYDLDELYLQDYQVVDRMNSGYLIACGRNDVGQLGITDTTPRSSPVQIGSGNNWSRVSAGDGYSAAIKTDGTLWTWGYNTNQ
jgi:alpha-tubulin suppressor-like RCC1 family protein